MKIAIVCAEFNLEITNKMLDAALAQAKEDNFEVVHVVRVPGVLEIPFALKKILAKKNVEAAATLGCVMQGQTEHDRLVAFTAAEKILALSLEFDKPVSMGISGPRMNKKQANARANEFGKRSIETLKNLQKSLYSI